MFGITYDIWERTCTTYLGRKYKYSRAKSCLQWYPFYIMGNKSRFLLKSTEFYNQYIENGAIVHLPAFWTIAHNYILKDDGSLREMNLVSPHLFLVLECFGRMIYKINKKVHSSEIKTYYAGDYNKDDPYYSNSYDLYTKNINKYRAENYKFIKTDISNFYQSININKLFDLIKKIDSDNTMSDEQIMIFKELLLVSGNGKYPTIEKSTLLSYLAVSIYLFEIDEKLADYLRRTDIIDEFHLIRYVDDLYIVYKTNNDVSTEDLDQKIIHGYSSILSDYGLSINMTKTMTVNVDRLNDVLSHSNYEDCKYEESEPKSEECFDKFMESLLKINKPIKRKEYNEIISTSFSTNEIIKTASFRLNNYIYSDKTVISSTNIDRFRELLKNDDSILSIDPKRFVCAITKTDNGPLIKLMLNTLYEKSRSNEWSKYYLNASITYLINRNFKADDLIKLLNSCPDLKQYCELFCNEEKINYSLNDEYTNQILCVFPSDKILFYLYAMYRAEQIMFNTMTYFAYYVSYFERLAKLIRKKDGGRDISERIKQETIAKSFDIACVSKCSDCLNKCIVHDLMMRRNSNPLIHSGAELLANTYDLETIDDQIKSSTSLSINKVKKMFNEIKD